jgi:fumarylacetoacetase
MSPPVYTIDETHDAGAGCWVESANGHPEFPVQNLPLGVFSPPGELPRIGCAIGDEILDLAALFPSDPDLAALALNGVLAWPAERRRDLRRKLFALLTTPDQVASVRPHLRSGADCEMHLPAAIGDYTDFYVGIHHATNIGRLFRPDNPLLPNYKHVPIGYHGRASSVRVSGTPVRRPNGQLKLPDRDDPIFAPSRRLDYELELGVWIGPGNPLGEAIPIGEAADHIAGLCLLNDWSARDIQTWEYQPLGPFLAKNFMTSISPWIVTAEALAPFRTRQAPRPEGDPTPLPYLMDEPDQVSGAFNIALEVTLLSAAMRAEGMEPFRLSLGSALNMYWTIAQLVAHHTANGCNLNPGDLLGTGTHSSPADDGYGALIEITQGGARPLTLPTGETRTFLEDGDEITMSGRLQAEGFATIGLGSCTGQVLPAREA